MARHTPHSALGGEWGDHPVPSERETALRETVLQTIPAAYALALRLRDIGSSDELIIESLGIEPEGLGPLLALAEAKLAAALIRRSH
jgi:hypothetical protein